MKIVRVLEVWEKGMDGHFIDQWPLADTLSTVYLSQLFADEQDRPDPDMLLSYFLSPAKAVQLQPYIAQQLDPDVHDYILAAYGVPGK